MSKTERRGIGELAREALADSARLVALDLGSAARRAQGGVRRLLLGAGMLLAGAAFLLVALGLLAAGAVLGLASVLPAWAAALVVGGGGMLLAGFLFTLGAGILRRRRPELARDNLRPLREDLRWLRTVLRSTT